MRKLTEKTKSRRLLAEKYAENPAGKYRQTYPEPYARLYLLPNLNLDLDLDLCVYLDLDLNLNLGPYPVLNRALFAEPFSKPNASSLASKLSSNLRLNLDLNLGLFLARLQPPRQSLGRPLPGRIVVRDRRTTTYGWQSVPWTAAAELPLFRENSVLQCVLRSTDRACARDRPRVIALAPEQRRSFRRSVPN